MALPFSFHVHRDDWSLHRQGHQDQERHLQKLRDAIRQNLKDIISEESVITSDGRQTLKVPIRSLNQYRFRYNWDQQERVGQGNVNAKEGDVVATDAAEGAAGGDGAGDRDGMDYYEADVTIDELSELLFEDLTLPHLDPKKQPDMSTHQYEWRDVRKIGLQSNLDQKRTLLQSLKRNLLSSGAPGRKITRDDLRYRVWDEQLRPQTSAVVLAMMDTSGSMGEFEKYIARSFFFWLNRFLKIKYDRVHVHFLAHSVEAKEVTEHEFFTKGESGGTRCSSVYQLALRLIAERYPPDSYNLYPFHFSDGDNLTSDNPQSVEYVRQLLQMCSLFGYGEIDACAGGTAYYRSSTLLTLYQREISHPRFLSAVIRDKADVYSALRAFLGGTTAQAKEAKA